MVINRKRPSRSSETAAAANAWWCRHHKSKSREAEAAFAPRFGLNGLSLSSISSGGGSHERAFVVLLLLWLKVARSSKRLLLLLRRRLEAAKTCFVQGQIGTWWSSHVEADRTTRWSSRRRRWRSKRWRRKRSRRSSGIREGRNLLRDFLDYAKKIASVSFLGTCRRPSTAATACRRGSKNTIWTKFSHFLASWPCDLVACYPVRRKEVIHYCYF